MAKMYAWSKILYGAEHDETDPSIITKQLFVEPGEVVTPSKLNITEEQFEQHVLSGSIRPMKFPEMPATYGGSPVDWLKEQAKKAASVLEDDSSSLAAALADSGTGGNEDEG